MEGRRLDKFGTWQDKVAGCCEHCHVSDYVSWKGLCSKEFRCLRLYGGRSLVHLKCYMQITFLKLLRVCFSYLASLSLKTHKIIIVTAVWQKIKRVPLYTKRSSVHSVSARLSTIIEATLLPISNGHLKTSQPLFTDLHHETKWETEAPPCLLLCHTLQDTTKVVVVYLVSQLTASDAKLWEGTSLNAF